MLRMLLNREFFLLGVEEDVVSSLLSVYRILTRMITMKAMNVLTNIGEVIPYIFFIRDTMKFVAIADTASAIAFFSNEFVITASLVSLSLMSLLHWVTNQFSKEEYNIEDDSPKTI